MSSEPGSELAEAVRALRHGEVVAVPTDTVYGLAASPFEERSRDALFALKGRPASLALPVLVADLAGAGPLVAPGPAVSALGLLARHFWPGPLTVVVPRAPRAGLVVGGGDESVGLRCPDQAMLLELLGIAGPLAVTSANRHGEPPCTSAAAVRVLFGDAVGAVLDGGTCDGTPSTVVSLLGDSPAVLRAGPITLEELLEVL